MRFTHIPLVLLALVCATPGLAQDVQSSDVSSASLADSQSGGPVVELFVPQPVQERVVRTRRWKLFGWGAGLFLTTYSVEVLLTAIMPERTEAGYVPIVGAFVPDGFRDGLFYLHAALGVGQVAGLVMMVAGLFKHDVVVNTPQWSLAPSVSREGFSLNVAGSF